MMGPPMSLNFILRPPIDPPGSILLRRICDVNFGQVVIVTVLSMLICVSLAVVLLIYFHFSIIAGVSTFEFCCMSACLAVYVVIIFEEISA